MMFASLRLRLWLSYVVVVGLVIAIASLTIGLYIWRNPLNDRREVQRMRLISNLLLQRNKVLNIPETSFTTDRLHQLAAQVDQSLDVRFILLDNSGGLLLDSRSEFHAILPTQKILNKRQTANLPIIRDESGQDWLVNLTPLENGNTLLLATPRKRAPVINILREEFVSPFMRGALLAITFSLLLAFWISNWVTSPLQRLSKAAQAVSSSNFEQVNPSGPREVQVVICAFNQMSEQVRQHQRSQKDFIANISHDLKTPLTSIQGFAQAIVDGAVQDQSSVHQAAQVIYDEAERMNQMVVDLLELARLDSGSIGFQYENIAVQEILQQVIDNFSFLAQKHEIFIQTNFYEDQENSAYPEIKGDAQRLKQAFSNLLDNALKYSPARGKIEVGMRLVEDWLEIWIADEGAGIPLDEIERIFERFYQTDKSRPGGTRRGVGLGLAIAREIIQAHGGDIRARNRADSRFDLDNGQNIQEAQKGSVFLTRLPYYPESLSKQEKK